MAMAIYEHAEELGKMAAEETGMGDPEHKVMKNIGKSTGTWAELKGKPEYRSHQNGRGKRCHRSGKADGEFSDA